MQFATRECPVCKKPPHRLLCITEIAALLTAQGSGPGLELAENITYRINAAELEPPPGALQTLQCEDGHYWKSKLVEDSNDYEETIGGDETVQPEEGEL
jgi:hypothetical protein